MGHKDLSNQAKTTYKVLRLGLAVLAFAFPPLLSIGGWLLADLPLAGSMSAYYHASDPRNPESSPAGGGVMRNEFVGVLFAVSAFLIAYKGYSSFEDQALNLAGILALGIALLPMSWSKDAGGGWFTLHGACAVAFFLCIAYVCIVRAGDTVTPQLVRDADTRAKYLNGYRTLGAGMVLLPTLAWILTSLTHLKWGIFLVEALGIYVFAIYWVVKSLETSGSEVDAKAARGKVKAQGPRLTDALKPLPVVVEE